ncbi:hypothetical protein PR202_gb18348 [Eleusine coracana subsp. coracana]|uniref:AAA+ ATPase domain-containing protein n=1 Tax=Eleusine coracana subsp. coracana TaxID=191504 RepID=A0AAV5F6R4_ELECO|nr:hypothetical protein QOZ80_3BG0296900 [Eleusine coracana subsp. coracana]GJN30070.1 hypothetical protein PR202_gb18348 [Eleusine coracana subsp. coracana]
MGVVAYAALALVAVRVVLSYKSALYFLRRSWRWADEWAQAYQYHEVPRFGLDGVENPLFRKACAYVSSLPSLEDADATCVVSSASKKTNGGFSLHLGPGHTARDAFLGARLTWTKKKNDDEERLVLRVRRHDRTRVLRPYLQHVESVADDMDLKRQRRDLRLYFNTTTTGVDGRCWGSAPFTHPATLETVAMDPDLKARVRADLDGFLKGRAYYHRLGRVWRRTYLLYGPPGTGKSTFAAAMARFLGYDVYEINLLSSSSCKTDSNFDLLRSLLLRTTPRSLILVENLHLNNNASTMLSFMDGLSSSCGEERVMVFTMTTTPNTNTDDDDRGKEGVLMRPGRLDVHIKFTLCDFEGFKAMATNYLGLKDHKLYPQVEESFLHAGERLLSPAELGEIMIANRGSPTRALRTVITKLNHQQQHVSPTTAATGGPPISSAPHRRNTSWSSGVQHLEEDDNTAEAAHSAPIREFKKLYGLIKIRSRREGSGVVPSFEGDVSTPQGGDKER